MTSAQTIWTLIFYVLVFLSLVLLSWIDFKTSIIPNRITIPLIFMGISWNYFSPYAFCSLIESTAGALLGYFLIRILDILYQKFDHRESIGQGDAKLLAAIGAILGWEMVVPALWFATLVLLSFVIIQRILTKNPISNSIPFGPFLSFSMAIFSIYKPIT